MARVLYSQSGLSLHACGDGRLNVLGGRLLADFVRAPDHEIHQAIEDGIRQIAQLLELDQGFIIQWGVDPHQSSRTHGWSSVRDGADAWPADHSPLGWVYEQAVNGELVAVSRLDDLPAEASRDAAFLEAASIGSLIALPLSIGRQSVGVMVLTTVAREVRWEDEVIGDLRALADVVAGVLDRSRRIAALQEQLNFETMLAEISAQFVNLSGERLDAQIEDVQRRFCETLGPDRSSLFQFTEDGSELLLTHLFEGCWTMPAERRVGPGYPGPVYWAGPTDSEMKRIEARSQFPWVFSQVKSRQMVVLSSLDQLPPEAAADKQAFVRHRTRSTVIIPLAAGGALLGCLSFACIRRNQEWTENLVRRFRYIATVFAEALARRRTDEALRKSEERFHGITTSLPGAVYQFYARDDGERGFTFVDPQVEKICGLSAEPLPTFLDRFTACLPVDRRAGFFESIEQAVRTLGRWEYEGPFTRPDGQAIYIRAISQPQRIGSQMFASGMILDITEGRRADEALAESQALFRAIIDSTSDFILSIDPTNLTIQTFNQGVRDYYRQHRGIEIRPGMGIDDLFPTEEYRQLWRDLLRRTLASGSVVTEYVTFGRGDLMLFNLHVVKRHDQVVGISVFGKDISEQKKAEEALRLRNQYIETVLENSPIGFAVHTISDGKTLFVSARFEEIYGAPRGTIDSLQTFFDKVWPRDPELREQLRARVLADMASGDPARMRWENVPIPLPSGQTRYITATNIPIYDQGLIVSTVQDVTEHVLAVRAVKESSDRFQQVAEVTNDFLWEVDADGLYTYTSPLVARILGYAPDELVGRMHFYDLFLPEERETLKAAAFRTFVARRPFRRFQSATFSKDQRIVYLETSAVPIFDDDGNLLGYRGANTDVTERRRAEAELARTLQQIRELQDQLREENTILRREVATLQHGRLQMLGDSESLRAAMMQAQQVAATDSTVLILGETGTGKGLLAEHIHSLSKRSDKPVVIVNMAAMPATLMESELFGHERGAYTGALAKQLGRFELADGGTIFLDEIGEMTLETQAKLLRVLQGGEFERLGSTRTVKVNVRVIAATNRDLARMVKEGKFREDLYYRLNVFPICLPPLREHPDDIPLLVQAFVNELSDSIGKVVQRIHKKELEILKSYPWPGNVRELRNVVERSMILNQGPELRLIPPELPSDEAGTASRLLRDVESRHVSQVLASTHGKIGGPGGAAQILGLKPTTLYSLMKRLALTRHKT